MYEKKEEGETVTHLSREEARGGSSTHVTRYVLVISLVLVIVAFAVVLGTGFFNTEQTGADETHIANATDNSAG